MRHLFPGISRATFVMLGVGLTPVALASAPDNDDFADASVVDAVPYSDALDTTEATTETGEADAWGWGPGASVWYEWTADADGWLAASTAGSEPSAGCSGDPADGCYDTTVAVWTLDAAGSLTLAANNDDSGGLRTSLATFEAVAGETYYVQLGAFDNGSGGELAFSLDTYTPPDPFLLTATLDGVDSTVKSGEVKFQGTIVCSEEGSFDLNIYLAQTAGRHSSRVSGFAYGWCDGTTANWTGSGFSDGGSLVGRATYVVFASGTADATGQFGTSVVDGTITAKGRGKP